jgi:glycosyltransferase involved in cell wall biosynthesis
VKIQVVSWRDPLNPKAGGAEVCVLEIGKRLGSHCGHELSWFAPELENGPRHAEVDGIPIERRGRFTLVHWNVLAKLARKSDQRADFYLEDYHGITLGLGWYLKKPHVILVHEVAGPIWLEMWRFPISWLGFGLEKLSLRLLRKTHFIAVSESTRSDLVAHGIRPEMISTISEGADIPSVGAPRPRAQRKQQFIFVGRICKMKRVDLLVTAFAEHRAQHAESRLILAGTMDEDFRPELELLLERLAIASSVEVMGRVSQARKQELLQESRALVSGSMREGFGLVVLEANSQGTPALTFRVNGYRDLIEEGKNGFMVEFPETRALASKMSDLVTLAVPRYEALCASSLLLSKKYSWDQTAEDVNRIIMRLTEDQR